MPNFTTHSHHETLRHCEMKRYLQYHYNGTGIVSTQKSIPLTTGVEVHHGIAHILESLKDKVVLPLSIDQGIEEAILSYENNCKNTGFLQSNQTAIQQEFTYAEQSALIEALIRAWSYVELPNIIQYYNVLYVEKEIAYNLGTDITLGSRADAILRHKETKDVVAYSLKTMNPKWWSKASRGLKKNLQVVTETAAVEQLLESQKEQIAILQQDIKRSSEYIPNLDKVSKYLESITSDGGVGVKFCILLKGDRREDRTNQDGTENPWYTPSPLIMGYKKFTANGVIYAHTNKIVKPENKSGYGRLPSKEYTQFNVWEEESLGAPKDRVKKWIELLFEGRIQGALQESLGNPITNQVVSPNIIYPSKEGVVHRLAVMAERERGFFDKIGIVRAVGEINPVHDVPFKIFEQNDRACHFPVNCEYMPVCWGENPWNETPCYVNLDMQPDGENYIERVPHYVMEQGVVRL